MTASTPPTQVPAPRSTSTRDKMIVTLCRAHSNPVGARVHTGDADAERWIALEAKHGAVVVLPRGGVTFCQECRP